MTQLSTPRPGRSRGIARTLLAIVGVLATTVVLAPQASAATTCSSNPNGSGELTVLIDEADGSEVVLEMRNGTLFVDGVACGTPGGDSFPQVFIADGGPNGAVGEDLKVDRVQINLAAGPWRVGSDAVFVNTWFEGGADGASDRITIRGSGGSDDVVTQGDTVRVWDDFGQPGSQVKFLMDTSLTCRRGGDRTRGCATYIFKLRGGSDLYAHTPAANGLWWDGRDAIVNGGRGRDDLRGTPVADRIKGGGGIDDIRGEGGNDRLSGNGGADTILGNAGNDVLRGNGGRDLMRGGGGNDRFLAQDGTRDRVRGGAGADTCECDGRDSVRGAARL